MAPKTWQPKQLPVILILCLCLSLSSGYEQNVNVCGFRNGRAICCSGWELDQKGECSVPICNSGCSNGGRCIKPNLCRCPNGEQLEDCPDNNAIKDSQVGQCYLEIRRGLCIKPANSILLTRELCCGIFNVAWGDPCRLCSSNLCPKGFIYRNGGCEDIDECKISKFICSDGRCHN